MNKKRRRVVLGYFQLSDDERKEFDTERENFRAASGTQRRDLRESHEKSDKMDLGPVSPSCPCCGR